MDSFNQSKLSKLNPAEPVAPIGDAICPTAPTAYRMLRAAFFGDFWR